MIDFSKIFNFFKKEEPKIFIEETHIMDSPIIFPETLLQDALQKEKILKVINIFETGSIVTNYDSLFFYYDGPNGIKQITLGRGFTEFGNLVKVVEAYANARGSFSKDFQQYVGRVGKTPSLYGNKAFTDLLKRACGDSVMKKVQDKVFEDKYWIPALKFFNDNKFTHPLSMLCSVDSHLHSGSILAFLRSRFKEMTPLRGGDEKKWVSEYVRVRKAWLASHNTKVLRSTVYRMDCLIDAMKKNNWDLTQPVLANGTIVI